MLILENIFFSYGKDPILSDFNLSVDNNEVIAILGPNGVGKSTLLDLINGSIIPDSGNIHFNNYDFQNMNPSEKSKLVSTVPQTNSIPGEMLTSELVLMGRNPHLRLLQWEDEYDYQIAEKSMQLTEIQHLSNRPISTLSGGEIQRSLIAMSLSQETPIILLDEPTSNLDISNQNKIMHLILNIQKQRSCIVIMTMHDLNLASQFCNRIIMLHNGANFCEGTANQVMTTENILKVYGTNVEILNIKSQDNPIIVTRKNQDFI